MAQRPKTQKGIISLSLSRALQFIETPLLSQWMYICEIGPTAKATEMIVPAILAKLRNEEYPALIAESNKPLSLETFFSGIRSDNETELMKENRSRKRATASGSSPTFPRYH